MYQWRTGKSYEKYTIPDHWYEIIRKMYQTKTGKGEVARLAKKIGVPRTKITNLARSKGWIPQKRSKDWGYFWCDKEIDIIQRAGHYHPISIVRKLKAAGFNRSQSAVEIKMAELRVRENKEGMSANDLSLCMGVDVHNVLNAIKNGKLKAKKQPGYEHDKAAWYILPKDVREYIVSWLPEIDIAKCDKYWLVDLLANA